MKKIAVLLIGVFLVPSISFAAAPDTTSLYLTLIKLYQAQVVALNAKIASLQDSKAACAVSTTTVSTAASTTSTASTPISYLSNIANIQSQIDAAKKSIVEQKDILTKNQCGPVEALWVCADARNRIGELSAINTKLGPQLSSLKALQAQQDAIAASSAGSVSK